MSGINVDGEVIEKLKSLWFDKTKFRFLKAVIRKKDGMERIVVDELKEKGQDQMEDFKALVASLQPTECCYIFLDLNVSGKSQDSKPNDTIFFITW